MAEYLRSIKVTIEKDTNKADFSEVMEFGSPNENETREEFLDRVTDELKRLLEIENE